VPPTAAGTGELAGDASGLVDGTAVGVGVALTVGVGVGLGLAEEDKNVVAATAIAPINTSKTNTPTTNTNTRLPLRRGVGCRKAGGGSCVLTFPNAGTGGGVNGAAAGGK
jgi:hypothetical protein